jgi:hypothetical protein
MNMDVKIMNKMLSIKIQQYIKKENTLFAVLGIESKPLACYSCALHHRAMPSAMG